MDKYNGAKCQNNHSLPIPTAWIRAPNDFVTMYMLLSHGWDTNFMFILDNFRSYYKLNQANLPFSYLSAPATACALEYFIRRYIF